MTAFMGCIEAKTPVLTGVFVFAPSDSFEFSIPASTVALRKLIDASRRAVAENIFAPPPLISETAVLASPSERLSSGRSQSQSIWHLAYNRIR